MIAKINCLIIYVRKKFYNLQQKRVLLWGGRAWVKLPSSFYGDDEQNLDLP